MNESSTDEKVFSGETRSYITPQIYQVPTTWWNEQIIKLLLTCNWAQAVQYSVGVYVTIISMLSLPAITPAIQKSKFKNCAVILSHIWDSKIP